MPRLPDHSNTRKRTAYRLAVACALAVALAGVCPAPRPVARALGNAGNAPDSLNLMTPALQRVLQDRGYAEMHLHYGAALDFPLLWVSAMHALAQSTMTAEAFAGPGVA